MLIPSKRILSRWFIRKTQAPCVHDTSVNSFCFSPSDSHQQERSPFCLTQRRFGLHVVGSLLSRSWCSAALPCIIQDRAAGAASVVDVFQHPSLPATAAVPPLPTAAASAASRTRDADSCQNTRFAWSGCWEGWGIFHNPSQKHSFDRTAPFPQHRWLSPPAATS